MRVEFQGNGFRAEMGPQVPPQGNGPFDGPAILRMLKNGSLLSFFSFPFALGSLVYFLILSLGKGLMLENLPSQVFLAYVIVNLVLGLVAVILITVALCLLRKGGGDLSVTVRRVCYVLTVAGLVFAGVAVIGSVLHLIL